MSEVIGQREERRALLRGGRRFMVAYGCARAWATLAVTGTKCAAATAAMRVPWSFNPQHTFDAGNIAIEIVLLVCFHCFMRMN